MTVSRVVVTGDLLRPDPRMPGRSESVKRIRWFEDLLAPPIGLATGLPVSRLACDGEVDFGSLYADAGLTPSPENWAALYAGDLPPRLRDRLVVACRDALVVGIELTPSMATTLADAGIPVLDSVVDPLRFLEDIPLSWRASDASVRARLEPFRLSTFEIARRVGQVRAKCRWMRPLDVPAGATLVLDQVGHDSALIDPVRRRTVDWADYRDTLAAIVADGPALWRPHPYDLPHPVLRELLAGAPVTTEPFYRLLSTDGLARVVAISSGGVVEARAFGKVGVHLLDRHAGVGFPDWAAPVPVLGHWASPSFWTHVLAPLVATRADVPTVPVEKHALRRSINCDWGASWIDAVVADDRTPPPPSQSRPSPAGVASPTSPPSGRR